MVPALRGTRGAGSPGARRDGGGAALRPLAAADGGGTAPAGRDAAALLRRHLLGDGAERPLRADGGDARGTAAAVPRRAGAGGGADPARRDVLSRGGAGGGAPLRRPAAVARRAPIRRRFPRRRAPAAPLAVPQFRPPARTARRALLLPQPDRAADDMGTALRLLRRVLSLPVPVQCGNAGIPLVLPGAVFSDAADGGGGSRARIRRLAEMQTRSVCARFGGVAGSRGDALAQSGSGDGGGG